MKQKIQWKKENEKKKKIKNIIIRDIRSLFKEEDYYKPKRVSYFWKNNYIQYESNSDRNKDLSIEEYFNKIKPYLSDITDL